MAKDLPVTLDGKVIYHIKLTDSFQGLAEELKQLGYQADQKICIISDSNVAKLYAETVKNILKRGAFTVSMGDAEHAAACDYVGIESGNSVPDKVARAGFRVTKSEHVDAPMIDELPLALECKLVSYDEETELLLGEVVNVSVDERALDENGKLAVEKLHVITFDYANHGYYVLGEKVASAFEDGKKFK